MAFINVGEENSIPLNLYFTDHGKGRPFVLIHGFPFSGSAWSKIEMRLLEAGNRVISYDRRGFGMSSRPSIGYDYDTFARDLNIILMQLDLEEVTLVGHSMGSGEITRFLSEFGDDRIANAVFISPIPPFLLKTDDNPDGISREIFDEFKEKIREDRYAFFTEFLKNFYSLGVTKHGVSEEKLKADFMLASVASPIGLLRCVDTWLTDFRSDLPKIKVPSLIIQGDDDKILPLDKTGKRLADQIQARLEVIKGGSHGITWTHANEISDMILDFCQQTVRYTLKEESSVHAQSLH